jgi:hypothetical protein
MKFHGSRQPTNGQPISFRHNSIHGCGNRNGLWHSKWFVAFEMVCGIRNGLWHSKWFVAFEMVCGIRNGLWQTNDL